MPPTKEIPEKLKTGEGNRVKYEWFVLLNINATKDALKTNTETRTYHGRYWQCTSLHLDCIMEGIDEYGE